ncbi:MAG: lysine--tRNA ligase [Candidatus Aenigmarchaeota archaeon]|nr:lysine--tRNA ligase [Candidatus Aenigmarchaeota archaeon]
MDESLFWSDQLAQEIIKRQSFYYLQKTFKPRKTYVVKTSASISGVLHLGRLSDTIRGNALATSLHDAGVKTTFLWVAEDMDPLRKIPKGVPQSYEQYLGVPVTDIPDPQGCHASYAEHNTTAYFHVLDEFVSEKMKRYSMRQEYKKGHFKTFIKKIMHHTDIVKEIQNKYRKTPLALTWSPWTPICQSCGKIITPKVLSVEDGIVRYVCSDYQFETTTAKGCGFEGTNDPLKGEGKLMWKSEWAAQWTRWKVCSEGAGKEYQVPGSAWWINGEIAERVLGVPMPSPIFYEHLLIDNEKMSASKGNVVYPADWLAVAEPQVLRYFYNKRLMKTRSFSWKDLPLLYREFDSSEKIAHGITQLENKKEEMHLKRLFEISQMTKEPHTAKIPYDMAAYVSQIVGDIDAGLERAIAIMQFTGHLDKHVTKKQKNQIKKRLLLAKKWVDTYAPADLKIHVNENPPQLSLNATEKQAISALAEQLKKSLTEEELQNALYHEAQSHQIEQKHFFKILYQLLISKDSGPRLGPFIIAIGKDRVTALLQKI